MLANLYCDSDCPDFRMDRFVPSLSDLTEAYIEAVGYGLHESAQAYLIEINRAVDCGSKEACPNILKANALGISQVH